MPRYSLKTLLFVLLAVLTLISVHIWPRFQPFGPELLQNGDFQAGLAHWQVNGPPAAVVVSATDGVRLTNSNSQATVQLRQTLAPVAPDRDVLVQVAGDLRTDKVAPGIKPWHRARLLLTSHDQQGKMLPLPHQVASLVGTNQWHHVAQVFSVPEQVAELRVVAQLSHCLGTLGVRNLQVRQVAEGGWYPWRQWTIITLWGGFLLCFLLPPYLRGQGLSFRQRLLLAVILAAIIVGTTVPIGIKQFMTQGVAQFWNWMLAAAGIHLSPAFIAKLPDGSKVGHFIMFLLFACFARRAQPSSAHLHLAGDVLFLAMTTELIQVYVEGRSPLLGDVGIDCLGGLIGMLVCRSLWLHRRTDS